MLVVMPYYPTDLKNLLKSVRRGGAPFLAEPRALRLAHGLLLAVAHLKAPPPPATPPRAPLSFIFREFSRRKQG